MSTNGGRLKAMPPSLAVGGSLTDCARPANKWEAMISLSPPRHSFSLAWRDMARLHKSQEIARGRTELKDHVPSRIISRIKTQCILKLNWNRS